MNDKKIIAKYIFDNQLDMEKVIKDNKNYVYTIIRKYNLILSDEDIEEIALDVFITFWNNYQKLDIYKNISPYLVGITKNLIKKKIRDIKLDDNIDDFQDNMIDLSNIEYQIIDDERSKIILESIKNLKDLDRNIFVKYYYDELNISEIAKCYKISKSKVKSKLFRTRKLLKKILKERGYDSND